MKPQLLSLKTTGIMLALSGLALTSQAVPISGAISFSGTTAIDSGSFTTATRFTSFQDVFVGAPSALSGSYAGTSGAAVTMTPVIFAPPTASTPIQPLWTFVSGGDTYSFNLTGMQMQYASATGLLLTGTGTAFITGPGLDYTATTGSWAFSAQTLDLVSFTFSSSTSIPSAVPDGGTTIAMLGGAVLCLRVFGRKVMP